MDPDPSPPPPPPNHDAPAPEDDPAALPPEPPAASVPEHPRPQPVVHALPSPPPPPPPAAAATSAEPDVHQDVRALPPPPPPPIALLPAPPVFKPPPPEPPSLRILTGNLPMALKSSESASRWLLVILDFRRALPFRLEVPAAVSESVNGWRPRSESSYTETYTSFFPSSAPVHLALLDTRSGERLAVWGEPETDTAPNRDADPEPVSWAKVVGALEDFLADHSLEGCALGPFHHREKPWAVRTRRDTGARAPPLPPTSMMDDEEAAIAAAIAASLADAQAAEPSEESYPSSSEDEEDDDGDIDMTPEPASAGSVESIQIPGVAPPPPAAWGEVLGGGSPASFPVNRFVALDETADAGAEADREDGSNGDDDGDDDDSESSDEVMEDVPGAGGLPIAAPLPDRADPLSSLARRPPPPLASSVESLAGSYMERLHSRFKSANDPALLESRLLRQEQDAELAASLEADRRKVREAEAATRRARDAQEARDAAHARLPAEPAKGDPAAVAIALRMPAGARVVRRFPTAAPLAAVADLCLAHAGIDAAKKSPCDALRAPGVPLAGTPWNAPLASVCGASRAVLFIVHQ